MSTITIRFEKVYSQRLGISTFCKACKKKLKRNVREEHTVNPWNTIEEDGIERPRSRREVWQQCEDEVLAIVKRLQTEGTICQKCARCLIR